jgi:hypothetical protein
MPAEVAAEVAAEVPPYNPPSAAGRAPERRPRALQPQFDAPALIPLDSAVACIWPVSVTDKRLHLRIEAAPLGPKRMARLVSLGGRTTILDPTGSGDARKFWQAIGRDVGWADAAELRREMGKVNCDLGKHMRQIAQQLGDAA